MDSDERELLDRILDLSEENNKILRKMQRANRIATVFHIIYYVVLVGVAIGAFVYLQPYIDSIMKSYSSFRGAFEQLQHLGHASSS